MSAADEMTSLYRVLAAIGFDEPTLGQKGMPTIAWPDTNTGITLPAENPPDEWETVAIEMSDLRCVDSLLRRLIALRENPEAARHIFTGRISEPQPTHEMSSLGELASTALYKLLRHCGFPRPVISQKGMPTISWPEQQMAIVFPPDSIPSGWGVLTLSSKDLSRLATLFKNLTLLHVGHRMRTSGASASRRISSDEQELLSALLRHGVPEPDRNYAVRDDAGKFRGVADFAWEEAHGVPVRVVLEVDGWHWHVGRDLADEIKVAAGTDRSVAKQLQQTVRAKGAVDAAKRRVLQVRGWTVIVVHDTEITPANIDKIAREVKAAIEARKLTAAIPVGVTAQADEF